jgi:hypothetical protein
MNFPGMSPMGQTGANSGASNQEQQMIKMVSIYLVPLIPRDSLV